MNEPPILTPAPDAAAPGSAGARPLLLMDIDGVISLFGFPVHERPAGSFHTVDGVFHFLSASAGGYLLELAESFELVWCSGWEEKANEYLPHILGLPGPLPFLSFEDARSAPAGAHWKLAAIDAHAGARALAWVDDAFTPACHEWAQARPAPTLLLATEPASGLGRRHVDELLRWRAGLGQLS